MIRIQDTIDEWLKVQAQWLYLDPIFSSEDIMQQMPDEGQMFMTVDRNWREIMKNTVTHPAVCTHPAVLVTHPVVLVTHPVVCTHPVVLVTHPAVYSPCSMRN